MIRSTSTETYNHIKHSGLLGDMAWAVYKKVYEMGPCTSAEAFREMQAEGIYKNPISQSRARFTELRDAGAFYEVGTKVCSVTGRSAILWDVSDKIPVRPGKKKNDFACKTHFFFVISKDQKVCSAGHHSLFPCEIKKVVWK